MSLKRTGAFRRAWLGALLALLFFGYEGVVIAHLVALGNWNSLVGPGFILIALAIYFLVIVGLVLNIVALFAPIALFANARMLHNVRTNVERAAPLATFQPDLSRALRDGETLTITIHRQVARRNTIGAFLTSVIVLLLLALSGEAFILPIAPAATNYLSGLITTITSNAPLPAPDFSIWDWLAVAFPLAVTLACIPLLILMNRSDLSSQIVADDLGVTQSGPRRRTRFIPWGDVRVFLRGADSERWL